ncbi:uncharacterized protein STEHIDRAFT_150860 [Stereum hirsutum FP-91666 SS1]|uniref:Auxiliary Activity family 9 catalytic domain-containing protein n=1 Tax=Stereum hirsutum (strain FP-91666) TaxID=721885 RepID=R7RYA1_STEHR|nr:uncharacterized protein STEHIDRAFT_150860 [Stereum hirsutum FP-91666 SS1]EIM79875.1 hypothetical protein STEHIDRAFT_150860 [Stereum hirsutum FP-91666 SS1]
MVLSIKSAAQASAILAFAKLVAGHGYVQELNIGGTEYSGYLPYNDPYTTPTPIRIVRSFDGNGPIADFTTGDITCNDGGDTAAGASATLAAGDSVDFFWTAWPDSHKGPTMTYMAKCDTDDCSTFSGQDGDVWFKIDHAGLDADLTTWASDDLIANNNSWTVTIPSDIASGGYLLRHELLALHSAGTALGAQFYPMCAQVVVTGGGSASPSGVALPGAYATNDPGILIDIYQSLTTYAIPGPTVYTAGGSTGSATSAATSAAATSAAASSSAATNAASSAAASSSAAAGVSSSSTTSTASSTATAVSSSGFVTSTTAAASSTAAVTSSSSAAAGSSSTAAGTTSAAATTTSSSSSTSTAIVNANTCMSGCGSTKDTCMEGAVYERVKRSVRFGRALA